MTRPGRVVPDIPIRSDGWLTRWAYVAAPALLVAYGVARWIDGVDGSYGPGPAWIIGHACFLAGLVMFGVVLVGLRRHAAQIRIIATGAVVVGTVGLLAFTRGILIDLIVGAHALTRADMDRLYPGYNRWPGGLPTMLADFLDNTGPALFIVGLLAMTIQLATVRPRLLAWWSPVLVASGFALISADLDLLPAGGVALLLAFVPLTRRSPRTGRTPTPATTEADF